MSITDDDVADLPVSARTFVPSEEAVKTFRNKWMPEQIQKESGPFWTKDPSRIYWAMLGEGSIKGWALLDMAKDLLKLYPPDNIPVNSATEHAESYLWACRCR